MAAIHQSISASPRLSPTAAPPRALASWSQVHLRRGLAERPDPVPPGQPRIRVHVLERSHFNQIYISSRAYKLSCVFANSILTPQLKKSQFVQIVSRNNSFKYEARDSNILHAVTGHDNI